MKGSAFRYISNKQTNPRQKIYRYKMIRFIANRQADPLRAIYARNFDSSDDLTVRVYLKCSAR